jgi:hypothetical protein
VAIQNAAPDAPSIAIEETGVAQAGFVPVAQLQGGPSISSFSVARPQRSGD